MQNILFVSIKISISGQSLDASLKKTVAKILKYFRFFKLFCGLRINSRSITQIFLVFEPRHRCLDPHVYDSWPIRLINPIAKNHSGTISGNCTPLPVSNDQIKDGPEFFTKISNLSKYYILCSKTNMGE